MRSRWIVAVSLGVLAACARTSPTVEIPPEELPFSVAREVSPTGSSAPTRSVTVYFVRGGRLVAGQRKVGAELPLPEAAVRALLEGPTPRERALGSVTELPPAVSLLDITVADGAATVDLSGEFQEPASPDRIALRVAQVTWTVTEIPGVREVTFAIDGDAVSVTTADGTTVDRPVRRSDYEAFAPTA